MGSSTPWLRVQIEFPIVRIHVPGRSIRPLTDDVHMKIDSDAYAVAPKTLQDFCIVQLRNVQLQTTTSHINEYQLLRMFNDRKASPVQSLSSLPDLFATLRPLKGG